MKIYSQLFKWHVLWIAKLFMDLIFHLVKRFTVYCFFCPRLQMKLDGDLLWFGYCLREGFGKDDLLGGGDVLISTNLFYRFGWVIK